MNKPRTIFACTAALFAAVLIVQSGAGTAAYAQNAKQKGSAAHSKSAPDATDGTPQAPAPAAQAPRFPPRPPFTAADDAAATIPGMPDARFFADATDAFKKALPTQPGPWLVLSTGGADGAFGAGLLTGLSAGGHRQDYSVVTGVSAGALMAPFIFAGSKYDPTLQELYTQTSAPDIFEVGSTGESFLDTWPLRDLIKKEITPELLSDIAAAYKNGRRLFIITTDLDAERSVIWNMGAIAVHATDHGKDGSAALDLFRSVLLASGSIPGAFPPVLIDVEGNGKHFSEMHVDGGVGGQFFVAPAPLMESTSGYKIPATALYVVVNSGLQPDFAEVERSTPTILAQSVGMAVKTDIRLMLDRAFIAAKNSGIGFNVASIPADFNAPSRGAFDPNYMKALFQTGFDLGKNGNAFADHPPAYPGQSTNQPVVQPKTTDNTTSTDPEASK
ncbi:MAG TPA: patatin-like phospholipase family protein [Xanthobacteraceae bacterium]|nr:patatin-like phospholipase family protein [Xanthobacteraceae bacterium]